MNIQLPFGKEQIELSIPDHNFLKTLMPNAVEEGLMGDDEVIRSLENPIHSKRLKDLVTTGQKVVIVTSDITRPMPSYVVLPHVLKELNDGGFRIPILRWSLLLEAIGPTRRRKRKSWWERLSTAGCPA